MISKLFKLYYLPYLLLLISLIFVTSVVHILLYKYINLPWYDFEFVLTVILPLALTLWCTYKLFCTKLNTLEGNYRNSKFDLKTVLLFLLLIPTISSQYYVNANLSRILKINNVLELNDYPKDQYFRINEFNINRNIYEVNFTKTGQYNRGRYGSYLHGYNLDAYLVFEFLLGSKEFIWYGLNYTKYYPKNHSLTDAQLLSELKKNSIDYMNQLNPYNKNTFTRVSHLTNKQGYLRAIRNKYPAILPIQIEILEPGIPNFEQRTLLMLKIFLVLFSLCNLTSVIYFYKLNKHIHSLDSTIMP